VTSPNTHDPKFMLAAALRGFETAKQRFVTASTQPVPPEEVFVPLVEALWWTVSVDDGFEELAKKLNGYRPNLGVYKNARDTDRSGQVLRGLRYIRDRCGHQRALAFEWRGPSVVSTLPMPLAAVLCWHQLQELPPPDPKYARPELQAEYQAHLAGRPAVGALQDAAHWFAQERVGWGI
jgi:hypothetical protein